MGAKSTQETVTTERGQSSVLFSLKELMHIEERRVEEERRAAHAKIEALEQARREADARAVADEAERHRLDEERQRAERLVAAREQAHREALRLAAVEKARIEALGESRVQAMSLEQSHERELAALRNDLDKKRLRRNIVGVVATSVLLLGAVIGIYFGKVRPESLARIGDSWPIGRGRPSEAREPRARRTARGPPNEARAPEGDSHRVCEGRRTAARRSAAHRRDQEALPQESRSAQRLLVKLECR